MKLGTVITYLNIIQKIHKYLIHRLISANISIFHRESATFVISRNTELDWIYYIVYNSFNFGEVLKDCFNKYGCNFDNISKIGYSRPS